MCGRAGLKPISALRMGLPIVLAVTVALKVTALKDLDEGRDADVRQASRFLAEHRFRILNVDRKADPIALDAERGPCVVRLYVVSPHGWHRHLLHEIAGSSRLRFLYDGSAYRDQPVWRTWSDYQWWRINRLVGRRLPPRPVFGLAPSAACGDTADL